jgi:hypothetical protein
LADIAWAAAQRACATAHDITAGRY